MSLWLEGVQRSYPALDGDTSADVAIVGAGIAGIATAYFLAKAGVRAIVLEARGVAEAASGRNAGFLLAGVAENFVAASRRYGAANALRIWRLTERRRTIVRSLVAEHGIDCELQWNGSDQIAEMKRSGPRSMRARGSLPLRAFASRRMRTSGARRMPTMA